MLCIVCVYKYGGIIYTVHCNTHIIYIYIYTHIELLQSFDYSEVHLLEYTTTVNTQNESGNENTSIPANSPNSRAMYEDFETSNANANRTDDQAAVQTVNKIDR
mgnify:CR=1 FL=1